MMRARVVLLVAGVAAFGLALRNGVEWMRWVGIALVAVALALRFVPKRG